MARQLGKVQAKNQSKAEKVDKKNLDNIQDNPNIEKSQKKHKKTSPAKKDFDKDDDDSELDNRIKTIAARQCGKVEAMKVAIVDRVSQGNDNSTTPVDPKQSINQKSTSPPSANSEDNEDIDKRSSNDLTLINKTETVMTRGRGKLEAMKQARAEESVQTDIQQPKKKD